MINNNVLIKIVRGLGILGWPDQVNYMRLHLKELLKGFPGIGLGHLSLVRYQDLIPSDLYILDKAILGDVEDTPLMIDNSSGKVIGIGLGAWSGYELGDIAEIKLKKNDLVLRVDCRPKETGGAGYYYFYKSVKNFQDDKDKF